MLFFNIPAIVSARDNYLNSEDRVIFQVPTNIRNPARFCTACLIIIFSAVYSTVQADSLEIPSDIGAPKNRKQVESPTRGMTMQNVIEQFGEATKNHSPIGHPPITRWVYPQFTVHFEGEFVIHSVIKK